MDRITDAGRDCPKCKKPAKMIEGFWVPYCNCGWDEMQETHVWDKEKMMFVRKTK